MAEDGIEEAAVALGLVLEATAENYRGEADVVVVEGTGNVTGWEPKWVYISLEDSMSLIRLWKSATLRRAPGLS